MCVVHRKDPLVWYWTRTETREMRTLEKVLTVIFSSLVRSGVTLRHKYQFVRPEKILNMLVELSKSWKRNLWNTCRVWNTLACRASMHSFHRLSILERATDHKCINNCNRPKEIWVGLKCNGPIIFSQRGVASKYNTCVSCLCRGGYFLLPNRE